MIIKQLIIKNFGKFQDKELSFKPGINVIYGKNESGKSTLHTFIKGVFFGIRKLRGRASANDVYARYEPWVNATYYEGMVRFICRDKQFRLKRGFYKENPRAELVCESDGEMLSVEDGDLSVLLGDISEVMYDNTISIAQLKSQTSKDLAAELRNYVSNFEGSNDGELDLAKAIASLKEKKKVLEQQKKAELLAKEKIQNEMQTHINYLKQELTGLREEIKNAGKNLNQPQNKGKILWLYGGYLCTAILVAVGVIFLRGRLGIIIAFTGILIMAAWWFLGRRMKSNPDKKLWTYEHLEEEEKEKSAMKSNLEEELRDLIMEGGRDEFLQEEIAGVELAITTIETLSKNMQSTVGTQLKQITENILRQLTQDKYTQISFGDSFEIGLNTEEHYIPLERLSRGTIEQVYFAFRMAVGEILCQEEPLPVLLDDAFAMYDEERLINTLHWLARNKEQVLLFTCHKREQQLLEQMGVAYHLIAL